VADSPAPPKKPSKVVRDWINRPRETRTGPLEKRRELSEALTEFVRQNGGWVISVPGAENMRIETPRDSALPTKLLELHYSVRSAGIGTRITSGKFLPVEVIEISLPGK
jgi:hypothetical protein